jgi:hypothetical protein
MFILHEKSSRNFHAFQIGLAIITHQIVLKFVCLYGSHVVVIGDLKFRRCGVLQRFVVHRKFHEN